MLPIDEINKQINFLNLDPRIKDQFMRIHTTVYQGLKSMKDMAPEIKSEAWELLVNQYLSFAVMFCNNATDHRSEHEKELEQKQLAKDVTSQFAELKSQPEWQVKYGGGKYQLVWHGRPFFRPLDANDIAILIPKAIEQMEGQPDPEIKVTTTPEPEPEEVTTTPEPSLENPVAESAKAQLGETTADPNQQ